jgi:hypothetical protein
MTVLGEYVGFGQENSNTGNYQQQSNFKGIKLIQKRVRTADGE